MMAGDFSSDFTSDFGNKPLSTSFMPAAVVAPVAKAAPTLAPSALFTTSTLLPFPADGSSPPAQPRGEYLTIPDYRCPVDLLLFRRFKREVPGLVEQVYADPCNYGLAALGVMPPPGTRIFVRTPAPASKSNRPVISLYD